jgi:predicted ABC-type exoprotein transport system permease subunit
MQGNKQTLLKHVIIPIVPSVIFFINAALPITVLGCANRGWVALIVALVSLLTALYTVTVALKMRWQKAPDSIWWIISTVLLMVPALALLVLG